MILERPWLRWLVTALAFVMAVGTNMLLQPQLEGRAPLLPFFPPLVFVGLFCGARPALVLLAASCIAILYYWIEPIGGGWPPHRLSDLILMAVFLGSGALVAFVSAWVGELMRSERLSRRRLDMALSAGRMVTWDWKPGSSDGADRGSVAGGTAQFFGASWASMDDMLGSVHPEDLDEVRRACDASLLMGGPLSFTCRMVRKDSGAVVWAKTDAIVMTDPRGRAVQISGVTVDVSDLAEAQQRLRQEGLNKDAFLATLAHELRNPIAPIRYAVAMLRHSPPAEQRERALDIIARQSTHMARLLDDLLDIGRITRDAIVLQPRPVDLREAAAQAIQSAGPVLEARDQAVTLETAAEPVWVDGDTTRLQQVLVNLLDNAAKYSAGPGEVKVNVAVEAGWAVLSVSDTGIGIAPAQRARIFDMFTRVDAGASAPAGLGIGLALSRRLVQLHGGTIEVEDGSGGRGSRFTVRLPLTLRGPQARQTLEPPATGAAVRGTSRGTNVLVVDDNVDGADMLAEALRHAGFDVTVAYCGVDALRAFERNPGRAALLDIGLPDISGIELARRLREAAGPLPLALIAISGWGPQPDRVDTAAAGFDAHLVKPVEYEAVEQVLLRLLRPVDL